jgi:hypothetical protein
MNIEQLNRLPCDQDSLSYFQKYIEEYFNDQFFWGYGTEKILGLLDKHSPGGDWLDLGAGTSTLFWSIGLKKINSISWCDKYVEAFRVFYDFLNSDHIPNCYQEALRLYNRDLSHIQTMRDKFNHFHLFDAFDSWPDYLNDNQYDLITELGTFGLAPNAEGFVDCFKEVYLHLKSNGIVVGANWIRSRQMTQRLRFDNTYLNPSLINAVCLKYNFKLIEVNMLDIKDPDYSKLKFHRFFIDFQIVRIIYFKKIYRLARKMKFNFCANISYYFNDLYQFIACETSPFVV